MNFLEALSSSKWVTRPSWNGSKMRFINNTVVFNHNGVETEDGVGADTISATDFELAKDAVTTVTASELKAVIDSVFSSLPKQPNRAVLKEKLTEGVIAKLTFAA